MSPSIDRRRLLALGLAAGAAASLPAIAAAEARALGDSVMGADDAPVTVIEYASFTCPHCANFHRDTWPKVKANYVETGKVKFILREVYFDPYGLWASMVARCGGESAFYPMAGQFLVQQDVWARAEDKAGAIQKIGRANGLSSEQMRDCLSDRDFAEALVERYRETASADGIESTPSFVVNGELVRGNMAYAEFAAILDRHLADAS